MNPITRRQATRKTPRMDRQVQRILAALRNSPMTVPELAKALFIGTRSAGNYIRMLINEKPRRIYISSWQPNEGNKPTRVFSVGCFPHVKYVSQVQKSGDTRVADAKHAILTALVLPQTVKQLAGYTGFSVSRTRDLVAMIKKEQRIYIKAWLQPAFKGSQSPVYAIGNLPDCVRLRRATQNAKRIAKKAESKPRKMPVAVFAPLGL